MVSPVVMISSVCGIATACRLQAALRNFHHDQGLRYQRWSIQRAVSGLGARLIAVCHPSRSTQTTGTAANIRSMSRALPARPIKNPRRGQRNARSPRTAREGGVGIGCIGSGGCQVKIASITPSNGGAYVPKVTRCEGNGVGRTPRHISWRCQHTTFRTFLQHARCRWSARHRFAFCSKLLVRVRFPFPLSFPLTVRSRQRKHPMRFVHPVSERYYEAHVLRDLFGDWTVFRVWGGLGTRRGGQRVDVLPSESDAEAQLRRIARRRVARGYRPVPDAQ